MDTNQPVQFVMLDLSTAHLTQETRQKLENNSLDGAVYYPKGNWGYFMYVPEDPVASDPASELPEDVMDCLAFAQQTKSHWITFDVDARPLPQLRLYEEVGIETASVPPAAADVYANIYANHLSKKFDGQWTGKAQQDGTIAVVNRHDGTVLRSISPQFVGAVALTR